MEIIIYPDERLRLPNETIRKEELGAPIEKIGKDMFALMEKLNGAGLAAPQVGINKKLFVTNWLPHRYIINPSWRPFKDADTKPVIEGCLSFPGLLIEKMRYNKIHARYRCSRGKLWTIDIVDFAAQVFQHETDHLSGKLMIDDSFRKVSENEVR